MAYLSVNSRAIIVPELGRVLRVDSLEAPRDLAELLEVGSPSTPEAAAELDLRLCVHAKRALGVQWSALLSFSRFMEFHRHTASFLDDTAFRNEIIGVYGGPSNERREAVSSQIESVVNMLNRFQQGIETRAEFMQRFIEARLLNPLASSSKTYPEWTWPLYGGDSFRSSLYWHLLEAGFTEVEIMQSLDALSLVITPVAPSCKDAVDTVLQYEIPMAGSSFLQKGVTLATLSKIAYGAAAVTLTAAGVEVTKNLTDFNTVFCIAAGGAASSLVFIGLGQLVDRLIMYSQGRTARQKKPASASPKPRRKPKKNK